MVALPQRDSVNIHNPALEDRRDLLLADDVPREDLAYLEVAGLEHRAALE